MENETNKNNVEWEEQKGTNFWNPVVQNEELEGVIINIGEDNRYGTKYTILNNKNETFITPCHKVLQSRMVHVKTGDLVKIVYVGEENPKVKGQKPTRIYQVFRKK